MNLGLDLTPKIKLILNGFLSSGGGRYIGGMISDVVVRANGDISPIKAHSWVSGFEIAPTRRTMFNAYYSGAYASRNTTIDSNGSLVGLAILARIPQSAPPTNGPWDGRIFSGPATALGLSSSIRSIRIF